MQRKWGETMSDYPLLSQVINNVQRSNIKSNKELVCKAVQEYYKVLAETGVVKEEKAPEAVKKVVVPEEPVEEVSEEIVEEIKEPKPKAKAKAKKKATKKKK